MNVAAGGSELEGFENGAVKVGFDVTAGGVSLESGDVTFDVDIAA